MAFCPASMDRLALDGLVSSVNLLTQSISSLGLPSSMSRFSLSAIAFAASIFRPDKDLQDDKEGYATAVVGKRDSRVA
ncbi:hypothetical protein CO724_02880 [Ectopseudomonas mendocina]|nr:hypothetical protein CO724_02880 [Pseudomonas mendocina]